ncbi:MAG TPA: hypothetical protein VJI69_02895 [Bacteroidia bacterium]|nr:hypothetical protein [Bacteroidia bacterium]
MVNSILKMVLLIFSSFLFCIDASAQQKEKKDESYVQKKEYSINADSQNFIRLQFFSLPELSGPVNIKVKISNIYGQTAASYSFYEKSGMMENLIIVFNGNDVATFTMEYFIEIIINEKIYKEEVEFPH